MSVQVPSTSSAPAKPAAGGKAAKRVRKRAKRSVVNGRANIKASFNNTIITITDEHGNKLTQCSAGQSGFKGSRKSTPFAAQVAAETAATQARDEYGVKVLGIYTDGVGPGRESAVKVLIQLGFKVTELVDNTRIPHNGVRKPKKRRV